MNLILKGADEGMRDAVPAYRKPTCLRRPVIRADGEFWKGGSLRSEKKDQCESPRIQRNKQGACHISVGLILLAYVTRPIRLRIIHFLLNSVRLSNRIVPLMHDLAGFRCAILECHLREERILLFALGALHRADEVLASLCTHRGMQVRHTRRRALHFLPHQHSRTGLP